MLELALLQLLEESSLVAHKYTRGTCEDLGCVKYFITIIL